MIRRRSLCRSTLPLLGHGHGSRCWTLFAKRVAVALALSLAAVPMERPAGCVVLCRDDTRCASADDSPSWSASFLCRRCY
ncbi:hypothetical protein COCC4DRAFT_61846 [Bipolaris maydis ATCC 48331]|uniref:Uncharacterized protein n=1 Tax=Cochliobolus heterostrophus (strain C4 / ATCC 48331 / race T) TaxID=665024 RepID=N4XD57_COCH4|nr:uncharacterized protein COCC4DRAFT_61846 [Bipolaris maydis ATCC 48331]ENI04491.1 hypothetical protein COCC4DRAFT_61846 [Bipolaris maydis ATCC 48331]